MGSGLTSSSSDGIWETRWATKSANLQLAPVLVVGADYRRQTMVISATCNAFLNFRFLHLGGIKGFKTMWNLELSNLLPPLIFRRSELGDIVCGELWVSTTIVGNNLLWQVVETLDLGLRLEE